MEPSKAVTPRIVSLVPSLTETLCAFGLQDAVVGCTSFCSHPSASVGGTKDARLDDVLRLAPTHVLVNSEENKPELIAALREQSAARGFVVHESFPLTVDDSLALVDDLGVLFGLQKATADWRAACNEARAACRAAHDRAKSGAESGTRRYVYFIWRDPWMAAGNRTYIANLLAEAGFENAVLTSELPHERYPIVDPRGALFEESGLHLFFSSEPFPFLQRHLEEFKAALQASGTPGEGHHARKVDGRLLSWYGFSTRDALRYVAALAASLSST